MKSLKNNTNRKTMCIRFAVAGILSIAACCFYGSCVSNLSTLTVSTGNNHSISVGMPNPFVDVASLDEAASKAGFTFNAPDSIDGYDGMTIQVIENDLIQVIYGNSDHNVYLRKSNFDGDVSGDYNDYPDIKDQTICDRNVRIKSKDGRAYVATWSEGDYNYSIQSNEGFDMGIITDLLMVAD